MGRSRADRIAESWSQADAIAQLTETQGSGKRLPDAFREEVMTVDDKVRFAANRVAMSRHVNSLVLAAEGAPDREGSGR